MSNHRRCWASALGGAILAASLCVARGAGPGDDTRTIDQKAADSLAAVRYEAAATYFQAFIDSSVGDPRVAKAKKQAADCNLALAREWAGQGREADAARLYLKLAEDAPADKKAEMQKQALLLMTTALTDAKQKHQAARALQLQSDFSSLFPDKTSPISAAELDKLAVEGIISAVQDKWNLVALSDVARQFFPAQEPPWDDLAKKNHGEPMLLSHYHSLADVGWAGRYLAEYAAMPKDAALRSNQSFCDHLEKMLVARADAWTSQGNVANANEAVAAAKDILVTESKVSALHALQAKLGKAAAGTPKDLTFPGNVKGRVAWQDAGTGFLGSKITLDPDADVTVRAGFVLSGGSIELQHAQLHLQGTAAQPVVLRDVSISLQLGSAIDADNTVFINCKFFRTGETLPVKFGTKWTFTNCMLYRTTFQHLGIGGIGIKMKNCALVEMPIPERKASPGDYAKSYNEEWSDISNCLFLQCEVATSAVWMTKQCNFVRCHVKESGIFDSRTSLGVGLYVPESDPFAPALVAHTMVADRGDIRYAFSRKANEVGIPAILWALLPVEISASAKER